MILPLESQMNLLGILTNLEDPPRASQTNWDDPPLGSQINSDDPPVIKRSSLGISNELPWSSLKISNELRRSSWDLKWTQMIFRCDLERSPLHDTNTKCKLPKQVVECWCHTTNSMIYCWQIVDLDAKCWILKCCRQEIFKKIEAIKMERTRTNCQIT